jgi:hypothetical protein
MPSWPRLALRRIRAKAGVAQPPRRVSSTSRADLAGRCCCEKFVHPSLAVDRIPLVGIAGVGRKSRERRSFSGRSDMTVNQAGRRIARPTKMRMQAPMKPAIR